MQVGATVAAAHQPSGRALPQLLPDGFGFKQHLEMALRVIHPMARRPRVHGYMHIALEGQKALGGTGCARSDAEQLERWRLNMVAHLRERAEVLRPETEEMVRQMDPGTRAVNGKLHIALIRELLSSTEYVDGRLADDLQTGKRITGEAECTGVFRPKARAAQLSVSDLLDTAQVTNARIEASVRASGDRERDRQGLAKIRKEFAAKTMLGPFETRQEACAAAKVQRCVLVKLIFIWEMRVEGGVSSRKVRVIADFKANHLNEAWAASEQYCPDSLDVYAALARAFSNAFPADELRGFVTDYAAAYRQDAVDPEDRGLAVGVYWDEEARARRYGVYQGQPFGAAAAGNNWARNAVAMAWLAARLLYIALTTCVDDDGCVERRTTIGSAYWSWLQLNELCGFVLDMKKSSPESLARFKLQGQIVDLSGTPAKPILFHLTDARRAELEGLIEHPMRSWRLTPRQAARLCGKLQYTQSQRWGKFGACMLAPLRARAAAEGHQRGEFGTTSGLAECLRWWRVVLPEAPPHTIPCDYAELPTFVLYTDGEGETRGVGCGLWKQRAGAWSPRLAYGKLPAEALRPDRALTGHEICEIELGAVVVAVRTWREILRDSLLIIFVDNDAAKDALVRGSSPTADMRRLTGAFWRLAAAFRIHVWVDRVASKSNVIDRASRGERAQLDDRGVEVTWVSLDFPESWDERGILLP